MQTIAIIGLGGTGSHLVQLLARKKFKLILFDRDIIEESSLDRQLFSKKNNGKPKVECTNVEEFTDVQKEFIDCNPQTIQNIRADLIIDCTDNMESRFLINDYSRKNSIPFIYTGAIRNLATAFLIEPNGPCLQCFMQDKNGEICIDAGVDIAAVGIAANLAINYLLNNLTEENLLRYDTNTNEHLKLKIKKNQQQYCVFHSEALVKYY